MWKNSRLIKEENGVTVVYLGGYGYEVTPDKGGVMLTRRLSECTDCPYYDDCYEWNYSIYPHSYPDGCRRTEDLVNAYDVYESPERSDYSELTDEEFESIKEVFEKLKED